MLIKIPKYIHSSQVPLDITYSNISKVISEKNYELVLKNNENYLVNILNRLKYETYVKNNERYIKIPDNWYSETVLLPSWSGEIHNICDETGFIRFTIYPKGVKYKTKNMAKDADCIYINKAIAIKQTRKSIIILHKNIEIYKVNIIKNHSLETYSKSKAKAIEKALNYLEINYRGWDSIENYWDIE